jgi:hypothetical protein
LQSKENPYSPLKMSSTKYVINVKNLKATPQTFLLFVEVPLASDERGSTWTNVYAKAPGVVSGADASFEITDSHFAVCGNTTAPIKNGTVVRTTHSQLVTLGPSDKGRTSLTVNSLGGQGLSPPDKTTVTGGYEIDCGDWNPDQYRK